MYVHPEYFSFRNKSVVQKVCNKHQKNNFHQHQNAIHHSLNMPLTTSGYSATKHFIDLFLVQRCEIVKYKTGGLFLFRSFHNIMRLI
jgi:hypothetical protein